MRLIMRLCCALVVGLLPLLASILAPTASASNFTVNSLGDTPDALASDGLCADAGGACTLRAAIQQANADPSGDVIGVGVAGTINLNSALPDISTSMTINGQSAGLSNVRRNSAEPYRIFVVAAGVNVQISNLTVSNGLAPPPVNGGDSGGGGGIYNLGALTLAGVTVSDNATSVALSFTPRTSAGGGGIQNDGVLTMTDCVVSNNTASPPVLGASADGGRGGGILNTGTLVMANCAVSGNHTGDGGLAPNAGNGGAGGGIYNAPNGARQVSASLTNCTVSGNTTGQGGQVPIRISSHHSGDGGAGGGIYNASTMTLAACTISDNVTGAGASVFIAQGFPPVLPVPAGKGGAGGGVYNYLPSGGGELKMINCVVRDNKTGAGGVGNGEVQSLGDGGNGAGVANPANDDALKMSQCTVVFNETGHAGDSGGRDGIGGGIYGVARVRSSLVALNVVRFPRNMSDLAGGPFLSYGFNQLGYTGDVACCYLSTDRSGIVASNADVFLKLDPVTLVPLPGSQLIDAGLALDIDGQPVTTDRRGLPRPYDDPATATRPGSDNSDIGAMETQPTDPTPTPTPVTVVQFESATQHLSEVCGHGDVTITRTGPVGSPTFVDYLVTANSPPSAHWRGDFTRTRGMVFFRADERTTTIPVLLSEDAYAEGPETFTVQLTGVIGGRLGTPDATVVTIDDNDAADGADNPIDVNGIFVAQHYHDFLSRESDFDGQAFWTGRLEECGGDPACLDRRRVDVSAAFFLSIEFQNTGYYVIRVNKVGRGDQPGIPTFFEFGDEAQRVGRGVVVGRPGYETTLEGNKEFYAQEFVERPAFQTAHAGQTAAEYVDSLFANVGVTPTAQERDAAIDRYNFVNGGPRGQAFALRSVVESGSVYNKVFNEAFVLMQYFAYLRRNPNAPPDTNFDGYNFWLAKLNSFTLPGEDARDEAVVIRRVRRAEMVRAFLRSAEYRGRFGGDPSRGNP